MIVHSPPPDTFSPTNVPLAHSYYDFYVDSADISTGTKSILSEIFPHWDEKTLKLSVFTSGLTNKLIKVTSNSLGIKNVVLVRIYGRGTSKLIDRSRELKVILINQNLAKLSVLGFSPSVYGHFTNGMVYGYVPGQVFTTDDMNDAHKSELVARHLAQWHLIDIGKDAQPEFASRLWKWFNLIPSKYHKDSHNPRFQRSGFTIDALRAEIPILTSFLTSLNSEVVFCHQDVQIGNIIYNPDCDSVRFIDYEYSGLSYRGFDIANHFCEFGGFECDWSKYPSKEFQSRWLRAYLNEYLIRDPTPEEMEHLQKEVDGFALASHFMWAIWALVQAEISEIDYDYIGYALGRLTVYYKLKSSLMATL